MGLCPQWSQLVVCDIPAWRAKRPGRSQPRAFPYPCELVVIRILSHYGGDIDRFRPAHVFHKAIFIVIPGEIRKLLYAPTLKL